MMEFSMPPYIVITGLVPVVARPCILNRDGRDEPGHDEQETWLA
jgi:hypothetical protein